MTITEKLEILFNDMTQLYNEAEILCEKNLSDFSDSKIKQYKLNYYKTQIKNKLFNKLIKLSNLTEYPQIVTDKDYENLSDFAFSYMGMIFKVNELYRGVRKIDHHKNLLFDADYHTGIGDVSNGIYLSMRYDTALTYTNNYSKECVLKLKTPNIKVTDDLSLQIALSQILYSDNSLSDKNQDLIEIRTFFENIKDRTAKENFANLLFDDLGLVAILLGYDAIYDHNFPSFALFNRGKICVSETESKRIKNLTTNQNANNPQPEK